MLITGFYNNGAPFLWGVVIGVLSSFVLGTLTHRANVKAISTLAAFIAGSLSAKYFFKDPTNATIFWFLSGLALMWLFYWALHNDLDVQARKKKLTKCPHCTKEIHV